MQSKSTRIGKLLALNMLLVTFMTSSGTFGQVLIHSGFENAQVPDPPAGWSVSNTGNANWKSLKNFMGSGNAFKGQKCMFLDGSYYGDQSDAWLYTPTFQMEAGKKYSISFYYKNQVNGSNTMKVSLGSDATPSSQTEIVWDKKFDDILYSKGQINYTATETGIKVVSFHCITPKTTVYIYIDEVTIKEVSCFEPLNIEVKNIATGSADFSWDPVAETQGYIYGISDTLVPPTNTRAIANNKVTISGLKTAKKYYLYVRSACSPGRASDWAIKEFATAYDASSIERLMCGERISKSFQATFGLYLDKYCGSIYLSREFFHKFTPATSGYYNLDVFSVNTGQYMKFMYKEASAGAGPNGWKCIISDVGDFGGKASFGPLEAGKEYIIMEKARAAVSFPSSYSYAIECYAPPPPNDSCQNALEIVPTSYIDSCQGTWLTTFGATSSSYLKQNYNECGNYDGINDDEVWIKFTANSDQELFRINNMRYTNILFASSAPGIYFNIFNNPCDLNSLVDCGYIQVSPGVTKEFYSYKLKKGRTYYCRIFTADQFTYARFKLCIMPLDVSKGIANNCSIFYPYPIDPYTDGDNTNRWVPMTGNAFKLISFINAKGNVLTTVNGGLYVNDGPLRQDAAGTYYLDRNMTINPTRQPSTPVRVRMLLSNEELRSLINQPGSCVSSVKDIRVTQNDDDCAPSFRNAATSFIIPTYAGDYNADFKVIEFETGNLSSFYLHGGNRQLSSQSSIAAADNSNVISNKQAQKLMIYPNPVKDRFTVSFTESKAYKYTISITNIQGKIVNVIHQNAVVGYNQFSVQAGSLPHGMYIIKVEKPGSVQFGKIIKE
ncbi:MAG: T9SS type A sorting domain-containing protein [Panacibacter sp.]